MDALENGFDGRLRGPVGCVARSYWKMRKVSSDQTISRVDMFQPKLPV